MKCVCTLNGKSWACVKENRVEIDKTSFCLLNARSIVCFRACRKKAAFKNFLLSMKCLSIRCWIGRRLQAIVDFEIETVNDRMRCISQSV